MEHFEGIILKKINYKESSEIIYLYTKEGLKSVLIHGSNKMKSPYLSLSKVLNVVSLHTSGKDLKTLRDGDTLKYYRNISSDLEKYTYVTLILEKLYYFSTHSHDHDKLYNFIIKIFDIVEENDAYIPYLNMVELKLLYLLGVNPLFAHCVSCDKTENLKFSIKAGGMCCEEHLIENPIISPLGTIVMQQLYYYDLKKREELNINDIYLKEVRILLDKYYEYHLNFKGNSRKMLIGLIGY
ncbi:MAG: DNA repair protein RecO [Tenericutes bacterium]|nr:DNA repair protein RecO [Mycoplasmatota bacterium]